MRPIVLALVIALGAVACGEDREPSAVVQPPTTFEGQPESLTTVPDSGSNDAVPTTTLHPAVPTGITAADANGAQHGGSPAASGTGSVMGDAGTAAAMTWATTRADGEEWTENGGVPSHLRPGGPHRDPRWGRL